MIRVFIAAPYGDPDCVDASTRLQNTREAMKAWHILADAGFVAFCPHLSHFLDEYKARPRSEWLQQSAAWVEVCDCVLAFDRSEGVEAEVSLAHSLGIPVFDSLDDLGRAYGRSLE